MRGETSCSRSWSPTWEITRKKSSAAIRSRAKGDCPQDQIEAQGLLDFDISITLHRDRPSTFGLGQGFFKINLIRWAPGFSVVRSTRSQPVMDTQQIITIGTPFIVFGAVFVVLVLIWEK